MHRTEGPTRALHSPPPRHLANLLGEFWLYEGNSSPHALERRLPDGRMDLLINLRDDEMRVYDPSAHDRTTTTRGVAISGPHARSTVIDTAEQVAVLGIHIKPGATEALFGLPADALRDTLVSLDALWGGAAAADLRERVLAATTPEAKIAVAADVLQRRVTACATEWAGPHPAIAWAIHEFEAAPHTRRVADVADQVGYSRRHFIQVFREAVGLPPKEYLRVRRFQRLVQALAGADHAILAETAAACGYYDQAHLAHDFREFADLSPSAYLAQRGVYPNHVPLVERER